jgi:ubiquinone/menaquinone biosynthesis C-methylase UbiE
MKAVQRWLFAPVLETKAARLSRAIAPHLAGAQRVLDFGCGDMVLTRALARACPGAALVGLDVVDTSLTELSPVLYDGRRIPYPDGHFDAACATFALHHCVEELDALAELKRVTRGKLLILEETYASRWGWLLTCAHDWVVNRVESWSVPIPFRFHTDAEWRAAFAALGCKVESDERVWQLPFLNLTHQRLYVVDSGKTARTVPSRAIA